MAMDDNDDARRGRRSIQGKMLVIILPLVVVPLVILAGVGFLAASGEASKTSTRYLKQRETDLRTIAENPAIRDFHNNRFYGLAEEAEVYRRELERSLVRFAQRSHSVALIYPLVRYVDDAGVEIAKVVDGTASAEFAEVSGSAFFAAIAELGADEVHLSPVGARMIYAMPVYEAVAGGSGLFQGAVVLDFVYPVEDFRRTTWVIALTFVLMTAVALGIAVFLTVNRVGHLTDPIRRLSHAANRIAAGERGITVDIEAGDEIGVLANAFNDMAAGLDEHETALRQKVGESTALYEIGREITAQVALEPTLDLIVERARALLNADISVLALRGEDSDMFGVEAVAGEGAEALKERRFREGEAVGGRVVQEQRSIIVRDYLSEYADSPFLDSIRGIRKTCNCSAPLPPRAPSASSTPSSTSRSASTPRSSRHGWKSGPTRSARPTASSRTPRATSPSSWPI
jgi:HAMP domain-containing protein